ncbi:unnamed protein product, partial [Leptidea sinapis]
MVGAMPINIAPKFCNGAMDSCNGNDDSEIQVMIGSRIKSNDDFGTVKYIGEVQGYNGIWYGVEWDNISRGKHDGCVDGIQYFKTINNGAGSFVRPSKISPMKTTSEAIQQCYGDREDELIAAHRRTVINEWKREMGAPFIEMVGFEKIHQKHKNRMAIDIPEDTLIHLSGNFSNLEKLNISVCNYEWSDILALSHLWPKITEIIAAYNIIDKITPPDTLGTLTILRLDGNPLSSWSEVVNLGRMKNLKVLSLNDCYLEKIRFKDELANVEVDLFENLEVLFLNRNRINDWRSVSELNKLKNLKKLYFLKNPVLNNEDYNTDSQLIIAKIGTLQELNGSTITREQRRGAEYDYIKRYGAEWKLAQTDETTRIAFDLEHGRFQKLIDKYGIPEDSLLVTQQKTTTLTSQLVEITLKDENGKSFKKKFPSSMAVQKLVTLAQRLFSKSNNGKLTLHLQGENSKGASEELNNVMKDLSYFSINNGDVIINDEKVLPTVGFKAVNLVHKDTPVTIYDLGGGPQFRQIWSQYYSEVHGVIFVIDSSDYSRLEECKAVLEEVLSHDKISDVVEKLNIEPLVNKYRCPTLVESYTAYPLTKSKKLKIDPGLRKGYQWLLNYIVRRYGDINLRVQTDIHTELERRRRMLNRVANRGSQTFTAVSDDIATQTGFENPNFDLQKADENGLIVVKPIKPANDSTITIESLDDSDNTSKPKLSPLFGRVSDSTSESVKIELEPRSEYRKLSPIVRKPINHIDFKNRPQSSPTYRNK